MRRRMITGAVLGAFAIVAIAAGTASAARLTLSSVGEILAPGVAFEAYGVNGISVSTSKGSLECEEYFRRTGLDLTVLSNAKGTDELQIDGVFGSEEEPCRSFTGNAGFALDSLGGPLKLRTSGKATTGRVLLLIHYEHAEYEERGYRDVECFYAAAALKGSNTATPARQLLEIELGAELKLDSSISSENAKHICPKTAEVSMSLSTVVLEHEEAVEQQTGR
jgi:hypothetical protein